MCTDIKQKKSRHFVQITLKSKILQLLLSNSEMDKEISKTHAENKPKYISVTNNL